MNPRVLFLADQFSNAPRTAGASHPGGAELTDDAAIEACPWPVEIAKAADFDPARLDDFDVHVIGNFERAPSRLIRALAARGRHVMFEHDLRVCQWNGNFPIAWEKIHRQTQRCICPHPGFSALYKTALGTIFLTHRQLAVYQKNPFFELGPHQVLGSSLMNQAFFERVDAVRAQAEQTRDIDTAVIYSRHKIKGVKEAIEYCEARGVEPFVIRDMTPEGVLDTFSRTRRFVYLPAGLEPAGRVLVEARFLGASVISNPNAGVAGESWWNLDDAAALEVLRDAPARFWRFIEVWLEQDEAGARAPLKSVRVPPLARAIAPAANVVLRGCETFIPAKLVRAAHQNKVKRRAADASDVTLSGRLKESSAVSPDDH
ncbi:hypothetical protein [Bradymonas sediminis]|uniref:Uncharacterized protein n=1 Tax=Bradymonas sediminis TaxID=1548548 RepID=A0A2Z4FK36_9DELT|nr:hypothetical protein [Bradymonas sediminis]AWV89312.1 hypothetical protein DN745_08160 [Bradymonas sediminis]TDP73486.1 hypothetical protein DFR33_106126 [Bradymonas sediminis]